MRRKIFISYKRASDTAPGQDSEQMARDLKQHLEPEYEVFMDTTIEGGELWNNAIAAHLASCDGAIALLSPHALTSQWVRHELSVLSHRRYVGQPPVCLLVAMLGAANVAELGAPPFQAMGISALEVYVPATGAAKANNEYADQPGLFQTITTQLAKNLPPARLSPRQLLVNETAALLGEFPTRLDALEQLLNPSNGPSDLGARRLRLAEAFLAIAPDWPTLDAALEELRKDPSSGSKAGTLQRLLDHAFPFWIKAEAAATIAHARATDAFPVLSAQRTWTVDQYLRRAEEYPDGWTTVLLHAKGSERDVAEQVIELVCNELLLPSARRKLKDMPLEARLEAIPAPKLRSKVFFPLVDDEQQAQRLLLLKKRWIVPLLRPTTPTTTQGVWVEPRLTQEDENDAFNDYESLKESIVQDHSRIIDLNDANDP
jgi:hypothetical protein